MYIVVFNVLQSAGEGRQSAKVSKAKLIVGHNQRLADKKAGQRWSLSWVIKRHLEIKMKNVTLIFPSVSL